MPNKFSKRISTTDDMLGLLGMGYHCSSLADMINIVIRHFIINNTYDLSTVARQNLYRDITDTYRFSSVTIRMLRDLMVVAYSISLMFPNELIYIIKISHQYIDIKFLPRTWDEKQ